MIFLCALAVKSNSHFPIRMKLKVKILLIYLLFALVAAASTVGDAEKAYRAGDYAAAETLYAALLKKSPNNRLYNHRYGVSLCEQNKDLAKAEKHLLKSQRAGISLSLYYLGRICFLQYKFEEAMQHYRAFMSKSKDEEKQQMIKNVYLPRCEQARKMLQRTEDVTILDRVELDETDFFLHYKIGQESGRFLKDAALIGEEALAPNTPIYLTERGDRAFFAQAEADGNIDLYSKNRLLDRWSEKNPFPASINTDSAEAYPFLMPDGIVLYFSSKGHDALGGYDLYVTRYNVNENTYLPPQQLGMPFNSFGNDFLFVIDEYNNMGWFASDRDSEEGKVAIYTFEPNVGIRLLETEDDEVRRNAAGINPGVLGKETMRRKEENSPITIGVAPQEEEHTIYFVLNDKLIYKNVNDFMSHDARRVYLQYKQAVMDYDSLSALVSKKRRAYSHSTVASERETLITEITHLEQKGLDLEKKRDEWLAAARRIELERIEANGGYSKPQSQEKPQPEKEETDTQPEKKSKEIPSQTREAEELPSVEYRIQFGSYSRILEKGEVHLADLSYYFLPERKQYKYFTGHFASSMSAAIGLEEVKAKGFKDAFVVKFIDGIPEK